MEYTALTTRLKGGAMDGVLTGLYGIHPQILQMQKNRYLQAVEKFHELYPERQQIKIFSAPGRTEIGGNHTDHQNGCVLAAAVNMDVIAVLSLHNEGVIRMQSEGHAPNFVDLSDLSVQENEMGTSNAMIRGICKCFADMGVEIGGFDAYTTSDVPGGSGLSSSAAFEVLVGTILDSVYNENQAGPVEIAKIGQYAENVYFGKASGLMDQMVSSVGGFVSIDFQDNKNPKIEQTTFDFEKAGYSLFITDTKGSHADLTLDYVSVPTEMKEVAKYFGCDVLREVDEETFYQQLPTLHGKVSDRAILRAMHFFGENRRAIEEAEALEREDIDTFFAIARASGASSQCLLQNLYSCQYPEQQGVSLGVAISERILQGKGVVRVHGGGFAGTIQAFVPNALQEEYRTTLDSIFGENSCKKMQIRPIGGTDVVE